ncbi:MAG: hypothetical protein A2934_04735 [Candidatus Sungbacteria bacterium RIFCSPLOWO2_01_FULL_47_10]|uniref:Uncharacterized protein n=1 Tax=Candidatus Sungbacteria bacterium RIFCSPLOWO2_01_FULL_47_10 TaxID=1802276 RepID=A0A1G2KYS9_9BACT|nr:MAG: hypothetical protein A2934_04735 [Candidatus Sungbacteria bacterium RIFCSPLOWO2_01_FULL_47_10]
MRCAAVILWFASFAALVSAWLSEGGFFWGRSSFQWYWDALVLGVLAIGLKIGILITRFGTSCTMKYHSEEGQKGEPS